MWKTLCQINSASTLVVTLTNVHSPCNMMAGCLSVFKHVSNGYMAHICSRPEVADKEPCVGTNC